MKKCKHKIHTIANEEIGGWNIPESCTTEYDIVCKNCGEKLGHWAYGSADIEYHLRYELNWWKRILAKLHIETEETRWKIKDRKFRKKFNVDDNSDLLF
mgnify:CR=1 FL=1|jgi:hypothetical protein